MSTYKKMLDILNTDKSLAVLLSGIVLSGIGLVSIVVTAGIWYL